MHFSGAGQAPRQTKTLPGAGVVCEELQLELSAPVTQNVVVGQSGWDEQGVVCPTAEPGGFLVSS